MKKTHLCIMGSLIDTYKEEIVYILSCYDRLINTGSLPEISFAGGMTSYMYSQGEKIFDYPRFTEPFKNKIQSYFEAGPK